MAGFSIACADDFILLLHAGKMFAEDAHPCDARGCQAQIEQ